MHLKEYLFRKKITGTDFSKLLGISRHHLNRISNSHTKPSAKLAKKIEEATKGRVTTNELLYPEDFPQEEI